MSADRIAELERENARLVGSLADERKQWERDRIAYEGALGQGIPGWHDGKLSDGTEPRNPICDAVCRERDELRSYAVAGSKHRDECERQLQEWIRRFIELDAYAVAAKEAWSTLHPRLLFTLTVMRQLDLNQMAAVLEAEVDHMDTAIVGSPECQCSLPDDYAACGGACLISDSLEIGEGRPVPPHTPGAMYVRPAVLSFTLSTPERRCLELLARSEITASRAAEWMRAYINESRIEELPGDECGHQVGLHSTLREFVEMIATYEGQDPLTTDYREIVRDFGKWARELLVKHGEAA